MRSGGLILLPHAIVSGIRGTSSLSCSSSTHKSNHVNCSGSSAGAERVWIFGCWHDSSVRTGSPALLTSLPAPRDKEIQQLGYSGEGGLSSKNQVHRSPGNIDKSNATIFAKRVARGACGQGALVPRATSHLRLPAFKFLELSWLLCNQPAETWFRHRLG